MISTASWSHGRDWPASGDWRDVTETLEPVQMLPAPAQGALAVECRADDTELAALLAELDDADTRAAVTAERVLLAELEAGCSAPVGAIAEVVESIDEDGRVFEELSLRGCVATLDGSDVIRASGIGLPVGHESWGSRWPRSCSNWGRAICWPRLGEIDDWAFAGEGASRSRAASRSSARVRVTRAC